VARVNDTRSALTELAALEQRYHVLCSQAEIRAYLSGLVTFDQIASALAVRQASTGLSQRKNDISGGPAEEGS
jgi:hypothetical protein